MKVSAAGIAFIKEQEGFRADAYLDGAGVWTIGYGTTEGVQPGDKITEEEAEKRVLGHVIHLESALSASMPDGCQQHQFDAIISLAYNMGAGNIRSSTLMEKFRAGKVAAATAQFGRWNKIRNPKTKRLKSDAGLSDRRTREAILFAGEL